MEQTKNVFAERTINEFSNDESRKAKESVKRFFADYAIQLKLQWDGLKNEDTGYKALNTVIAGIAGSKGEKPEIWLVKNFSRYVDADGVPCNRKKEASGKIIYTRAKRNGATARGLLKKAALNCIESNRQGNRFSQTIVNPEK